MITRHDRQHKHTRMDRRINSRIDAHIIAFKNQIAAQFETVRQKHAQAVAATPQLMEMQRDYTEIMNFIYGADKLKLTKDDFAKRKRVKNAVPVFDRCHAKRANGEQCTRRKKDGCLCCGTHTKGTPHGMFNSLESPVTNINGDWTRSFNSAYVGEYDVTVDGKTKNRIPNWTIKDYDNQIPLSCHEVDMKSVPDEYDATFVNYRLV